MNFLALLMFSIAWLHTTGSNGEIADITGSIKGGRTEIDYPGRAAGESKLKLLKVSAVAEHIEAGRILPDDILLIISPSGELVRAGQLTAGGRLRRISPKESFPGLVFRGGVTWRKAGSYCRSFRKAAGVKVLRKPWFPYHYTKRECFVPMRDGVKLYTAVYEAPDAGPKPIIMMRSTYNVGTYGNGGVGDLSYPLHCFTDRGYIIVEQNVRGCYMSEGEFEDIRPLGGETDEATDTYDTIDWLLANTSNNGSVGIYGVSYPGFYATLAATCGHPALKAVSPQAPVTDWWKGDDAHHNGAFMLGDIYGFGAFFFRPKGNPTPDTMESLVPMPDGEDFYEFYKGKAISSLLEKVKDLRTFQEIVTHPGYDSFWRDRSPLRHLAKGVKPAVMVVGGLYDAEDCWGAINTWETLKAAGADANGSCFVFGPWSHDGWRKDPEFLEKIEAPFFEYYLEGKGEKPAWKELYMPSGVGISGTGEASGVQRAGVPASGVPASGVPASGVQAHGVQGAGVQASGVQGPGVHASGVPGAGVPGAGVQAPGVQGEILEAGKLMLFDPRPGKELRFALEGGSYVSDPANPVPYMDVKSGWRDKTYMWADQRFASVRPAVLTQTVAGPLDQELFAFGPVSGRLRFSVRPVAVATGAVAGVADGAAAVSDAGVTGAVAGAADGAEAVSAAGATGAVAGTAAKAADKFDVDLVVKLIDVSPDGSQNLVRGDVFPARWRSSETEAEPLRSGEIAELSFEMNRICHIFAPGHSIMVQLQSSWFPIVAMNSQTFLENPYTAKAGDYIPLEITILSGSEIIL